MLARYPIRLAGSSLVALAMLSIPGFTTLTVDRQPFVATPSPANTTPVQPVQAKKKKFSFLPHSATVGIASWYGAVLNGHKTASGETFDMNQMTACHRSLPFGTMVRVVDVHSGKSVIVKINDRGVLFADRVIDLSRAAAEELGMRAAGVANVRLEILSRKKVPDARLPEVAAATSISTNEIAVP